MSASHNHDSGGPPWMNRLMFILTVCLVILMAVIAFCARRQTLQP